MGDLVNRISAAALALGGPGLFLLAFLDSSFVPLPEANDLLLIYMVMQYKSWAIYYAVVSTLGSLTGCLVLYAIGRKGDQWVMRRLSAERVERTLATFQQYGVMAVLIPSLLPPPAPFKIFMLLAGLAGITPLRFTTAIIIGRGIRFFGLAWLAVTYGDRAIEFLHQHGTEVALWLVGLLAVGLGAYILYQRRRRQAAPIH
ncbi:MAG: VTT domain-containing protein [Acidobacteriaceae bacterium]|jgi:membrane protein YqaA with SNARE-associated domain|nr:VTT domain-containing protein [Acidobacteriaceae bacterium]